MNTQQEEQVDMGKAGGASEGQGMVIREEEKATYWNRIFTGDVRSIPQEVKDKVGVPLPLSEEEDALLAGTVVRSWAADHLPFSREKISSGWGEIRRGIAHRLGTGEDDQEIFLALSERNKVQKEDKEQLAGIYAQTYDRSLRRDEVSPSEEKNWRTVLPERLHPLGVQMETRAASEARDDRSRLNPVLEKLENGVNSIIDLEVPDVTQREEGVGAMALKSYWNSRIDLRSVAAVPKIVSAVNAVNGLNDEDRKKVYGMLSLKAKDKGVLGERVLRALNRGILDIAYNAVGFGVNSYAIGVEGIGNDAKRLAGISDDWAKNHSSKMKDALRVFEELKQYVRNDVAPLYDKGDSLAEQMLLDGVSSAAPAALAFTGSAGIGLLAASEAGRQMTDARAMNPEGDYNDQMGAAALSGIASSVLSLGMTKLGQKVVSGAFNTFRSAKGASGVSRSLISLGGRSARMAGDVASMSAENKAQELIQYGAQEAAAGISGNESGVPWEEWADRQMDSTAQAREAAGLFPFLLIAAGKSSLRHFRNPGSLLKEGHALSRLGIPDDVISRISAETDLDVQTALVREAVRSQPLWGSLFLGRKAFQWAKILEHPQRPMFFSENEAREFLDMGPVRIEKPWGNSKLAELAKERGVAPPDSKMNASIVRERWFMRAGIPQSRMGDASDFSLQHWEVGERREESMALAGVRNRRSFIPEGLSEPEAFDPSIDRSRREFMASRLEEIGRRPYKVLLLKFKDVDQIPAGMRDWDAVTDQESQASRELIAEGAKRISQGKSWDEVRAEMSSSWWSRWMRKDAEGESRVYDWIRSSLKSIPEDKRWGVPLCRNLVREMNSEQFVPRAESLKNALSEMECYAADASDSFRDSLPEAFRALCRLSWGEQADARMLSDLIPNLHEFDVMSLRGLTPAQSFEAVLKRHLNLENELKTLLKAGETSLPAHRWMKDVMKRLELITPGLMESTLGVDGKKLWRVRYPNGDFSSWHGEKKEAWKDMEAHLSIVYSPVGISRRAMIRDWHSVRGLDVVDSRIREGMESLTLIDDLAVRATADLVSQGYGRRSYRAPGNELVIHPGDTAVPLQEIMGREGVDSRIAIYEKYVGPAIDVAAEASNMDVENAKGLIMNRLELYRTSSPLGIIEDRAEVSWDRMLRTGQLDPSTAWQALTALGRARDKQVGDVYGDYVRLSEELSQLSKEWYMGHLDDPSVPASAAMWLRYSIARPLPTDVQISKAKDHASRLVRAEGGKLGRRDQRHLEEWSEWAMTEEMRRIAESSRSLREKVVSSGLPDHFVAMLADSAGMNRHARAERFWALSDRSDMGIFPMMERYVHSLSNGSLLDVLPKHIAMNLIPSLARKRSDGGESVSAMEKEARSALAELSENLRLHPDIALWNPDPEIRDRYRVLQEKVYPSFDRGGSEKTRMWNRKLSPAEVKEPDTIDNDWVLSNVDSLPDSWAKDPSIRRSIETLGLIRRDFAARPVPSNEGIYWQGRVLRHDTPFSPAGIPDSWGRDVPLGSGLEGIFHLLELGKIPQGAHFPMIHDWSEAFERFNHCVIYMNPFDKGHTVRLMPGSPEAALKEARSPYVVHVRDGVFLNEGGYPVTDYRDSYIPLERFHLLTPNWEMTPTERETRRRASRDKLLAEIADPELQKKFWWDTQSGDGSFSESVIRLYEELGIRRDYERGVLKLTDPAFVESLRFVSHVLNYPKWLAGGFEYGLDSHRVILDEGKAWRRMFLDRDQ